MAAEALLTVDMVPGLASDCVAPVAQALGTLLQGSGSAADMAACINSQPTLFATRKLIDQAAPRNSIYV